MAITLDEIQASLHSIKISDGTNDLLIDASGHLSINDGGNSITVDSADLATLAGAVAGTEVQVDIVSAPTLTVSATDLDVRDLTHVSDSVKVGDGTDFLAVAADGSIAVSAVGGSFAVTATDLDVRDLTHVSDSIKIGDGTDFLAVNADGSINVQSAPAGLDSWQTSTLSATTTAAEIAAIPLSNRLRMVIQNLGTNDVYLGESNAVTTSSGVKLPKGSSMEMNYGASANIWAITAAGTADLRVAEFAD